MVDPAESCRAPTISIADIAKEVRQEAIDDEGFDLAKTERSELRARDSVFLTFQEERFREIIQGIEPNIAQPWRHGFYYAHRVSRRFSAMSGIELPRFESLDEIHQNLRGIPDRSSLSHPGCSAEAFAFVYEDQPELVKEILDFTSHPAQDGAGLLFMIYRGALLGAPESQQVSA